MTMRLLTARLLIALLFSCLAAFPAHAAALDLDGPGWSVVDSTDCPESPETVAVNAMPAWRFEIEETCQPRAVLRDVNDELRAAIKRGDASLVVKLHVANAYLRSAEDGGANTYATLMLQGKDDDRRQWASGNRIKLVDGTHTVTVQLERTSWTGATGENAPETAWNEFLANLDKIGIALGGESAEDQGVKGSAGLFMLEFKVD